MTDPIRLVSCPTCRKLCAWNKTNTWKPFCSKRCSMIDLGAWANDEYHIAGENNEVNLVDSEEDD